MLKEFLLKYIEKAIQYLLFAIVTIIMFFLFLSSLVKNLSHEPFANKEVEILFIFTMGIIFAVSSFFTLRMSKIPAKNIAEIFKLTVIEASNAIVILKQNKGKKNVNR